MAAHQPYLWFVKACTAYIESAIIIRRRTLYVPRNRMRIQRPSGVFDILREWCGSPY